MGEDETLIEKFCTAVVELDLNDGSQEHWNTVQCMHWIAEILIEQERQIKNINALLQVIQREID